MVVQESSVALTVAMFGKVTNPEQRNSNRTKIVHLFSTAGTTNTLVSENIKGVLPRNLDQF